MVDIAGFDCSDEFEDYAVTCDACGKVGHASRFMVEEGDRWECPECWERFESFEKAAQELSASIAKRKAECGCSACSTPSGGADGGG